MKKLIRWTLDRVPRPVIQRFVHIVIPVTSVLYRGRRYQCPVCGGGWRKMLPYGYIVSRENALCPCCLALERHRLFYVWLSRETGFFEGGLRVLHVAPERCFIRRFKKLLGEDYVTADLESPLADMKFDVQDIPLGDGEFDVVICNHLLEHVEDDRKALSELYRVMKPGGWGVMMCPVTPGLMTTREDPALTTPQERERAFGQKDHVREYGADYPIRLSDAGFDVDCVDYFDSIDQKERQRFSLRPDIIYKVSKPGN